MFLILKITKVNKGFGDRINNGYKFYFKTVISYRF